MNGAPFLVSLLVMAGITYLVRVIPSVLAVRPIKNEYLLAFLHYVPYAVLAVMTFPAAFYATSTPLSALVGIAVAVVLALFERGLFTVAISACGAVFLTELIMQTLA